MTRPHFAILLTLILTACGSEADEHGHDDDAQSHSDHQEASAEAERGPHRGRLLRDGDFALELQIFEDGVPPQYRVYLFRDDKPLPPDAATVGVELTRLGDKVDRFTFTPMGDYLSGSGTVEEPHSFSVVVTASEGGREHRWAFDSFEGRTTIPATIAADAGVGVEAAGPATLLETVEISGRVVPDAERVRAVSARFPGPIRKVTRSIGDRVAAGDTLAIVESNESLQTYAVTAPIAGTVIERHANPGESAGSEALFVIADYRRLWVELSLFPRDLARVRPGLRVDVQAVEGGQQAVGKILRIAPNEGPGHGAASSVYTARIAVDNTDGRWVPGMFVKAAVRVGETRVPLAVKKSGLQAFRDFTVVFAQVGDTYEVRMLELGRQDATWAEVVRGLEPGTSYVSKNSYLIKADIEKAGASHDH